MKKSYIVFDLAHQLLVMRAQQLEHLVAVAREAVHDVGRLLHPAHLRTLGAEHEAAIELLQLGDDVAVDLERLAMR